MDIVRRMLWKTLPGILSWWGRCHMRLFGCTVDGSARIYGSPILWRNRGSVAIGKRVELHSIRAMAMIGQEFPACFFATAQGGSIVIDDDAIVVASALFAQQEIRIGKRVMIAAGCRILDSNMHPVDAVPHRFLSNTEASPVILEDDVWLCNEVTVCPGVRIGKGSVIGAKSVVTSSIPPMVMAAGIPAVVMRPLLMQ
jgi:acetyltransferase-like isoleucine patch superfamily enzyme